MAKPYFKEWRAHRELTQEQVIGRLLALDDPMLPTTAASLSRLENGKQIYTQRSLEALADIYQVDPDDLLRPPPPKGEGDTLHSYVRQLDEVGRRRALALLRAMDAAAAAEESEARRA
jgi:transcriptional regulator with XRE-family HTH domain